MWHGALAGALSLAVAVAPAPLAAQPFDPKIVTLLDRCNVDTIEAAEKAKLEPFLKNHDRQVTAVAEQIIQRQVQKSDICLDMAAKALSDAYAKLGQTLPQPYVDEIARRRAAADGTMRSALVALGYVRSSAPPAPWYFYCSVFPADFSKYHGGPSYYSAIMVDTAPDERGATAGTNTRQMAAFGTRFLSFVEGKYAIKMTAPECIARPNREDALTARNQSRDPDSILTDFQ